MNNVWADTLGTRRGATAAQRSQREHMRVEFHLTRRGPLNDEERCKIEDSLAECLPAAGVEGLYIRWTDSEEMLLECDSLGELDIMSVFTYLRYAYTMVTCYPGIWLHHGNRRYPEGY